MKYTIFCLLFAAFAFTACNDKASGGSEYPEFNDGETFELGLRQTMKMKGKKLTVSFPDVTQDSRCPEGVNCVRAGEVKFVLQTNDEMHNLVQENKKPVNVETEGYKITVEEVMPYPKSTVTKDPDAYKLKMSVTKI